MQQSIATIAAITLLEPMMLNVNQPSQQSRGTEYCHLNAGFTYQHYSKYQTVGQKIDAHLQNRKSESSPDMIEKFYFNLLPITYRDWMSK